jgi:cytochrome P450
LAHFLVGECAGASASVVRDGEAGAEEGRLHRLFRSIRSSAPDHTRIRKAVSGAFTPRRYRALAPFVRDTVGTMLDAMLAKPIGDLVADLAYDLPALTILTLLGVEAEKVAEVKRWAKSRTVDMGQRL